MVLSPGLGLPRAGLTSLAEGLAGRGYVVASIDHAYALVTTTAGVAAGVMVWLIPVDAAVAVMGPSPAPCGLRRGRHHP